MRNIFDMQLHFSIQIVDLTPPLGDCVDGAVPVTNCVSECNKKKVELQCRCRDVMGTSDLNSEPAGAQQSGTNDHNITGVHDSYGKDTLVQFTNFDIGKMGCRTMKRRRM